MSRRPPQHARSSTHGASGGVDGNSRLTGATAAVILVLLALEGVTILKIHSLLTIHVFIGALLIPPIIVKIASTSWRFTKYYGRSPDYVRRGPPAPILRLLGPMIVVLTIAVMASGVGLVVGAPHSWRVRLLQIHQVTFVLWFMVTALHVLGHLFETMKLAPLDWFRATRRQVNGASTRQWVVVSGLAIGFVAAVWITPYASGWGLL